MVPPTLLEGIHSALAYLETSPVVVTLQEDLTTEIGAAGLQLSAESVIASFDMVSMPVLTPVCPPALVPGPISCVLQVPWLVVRKCQQLPCLLANN